MQPPNNSQLTTSISSSMQLAPTLVATLDLAPEYVIGTKTNRFTTSNYDDFENLSNAAKRVKQQQESRTKKERARRVINLDSDTSTESQIAATSQVLKDLSIIHKSKTNSILQTSQFKLHLNRMTEAKSNLRFHLHRITESKLAPLLQITNAMNRTSHHLVSLLSPTTHTSPPKYRTWAIQTSPFMNSYC